MKKKDNDYVLYAYITLLDDEVPRLITVVEKEEPRPMIFSNLDMCSRYEAQMKNLALENGCDILLLAFKDYEVINVFEPSANYRDCPKCHARTFNLHDIQERYCAKCRSYSH